MRYSIQDIATIIKGEPFLQQPDVTIEHLFVDSRKLVTPATSLFFSLAGPRRNGHLFIPELYEKSVFNFVVSEPADTLKY
ncbi:MAG TPA: hypothetical protein VEZ17_01795, partial [Chitinophagaceae bacterium]|nr:hypothetical protein [Chitinophagaceae bacterium]